MSSRSIPLFEQKGLFPALPTGCFQEQFCILLLLSLCVVLVGDVVLRHPFAALHFCYGLDRYYILR